MRRIAFLAAALTLLAAAPSGVSLHFSGHWEVVHGRHDGRFGGASARSFHAGDMLELRYLGTAYCVYGVTGPNGGRAVVVGARTPDQTIDFYSPVKRVHVLLYTAPRAFAGRHEAAIIVAPQHDPRSRGSYVNIESVDVLP